MQKYDFFIAGRWRNKDNIKPVLDAVRASGKTAYCFIENEYTGKSVELTLDGDPEVFMKQTEELAQDDTLIQKIFETDIAAERAAESFLLVFPAGRAAHIEAGVAYGLGKKCYAIGKPDQTETLYCIFSEIFPDIDALREWLAHKG
jgi:hypothetical protein